MADDIEERAAASRNVAAEFMSALKAELMKAMREGGPANAIKVCRDIAPEIAARKSRALGWRVARTSLKVRNPANAPDAIYPLTLNPLLPYISLHCHTSLIMGD